MTRSPASTRFAISSSATSKPFGTCSDLMFFEDGVLTVLIGNQRELRARPVGSPVEYFAGNHRAGIRIDPDLHE